MLKILPALAWLGAAVTAPGAVAPATFKVAEFTFTRPAKWELTENKSRVRMVELRLNDPKTGEMAEMLFSDIVLSFDRKPRPLTELEFTEFVTNNFDQPIPMMETNVAGRKVTFLNTKPDSETGKPRASELQQPGAKHTYALIESKEGNVSVMFFGSRKFVDASEKEFRKMIESAAAGK